MLREITIKNFKSIHKETFFSMEASPKSFVSEFPGHVIPISKKEGLLKVTSFYGPNGGGKSNVLEAISFLRSFIGDGKYGNNLGQMFSVNDQLLNFAFSKDKNIELTPFFVINGYDIGFKINFSAKPVNRTIAPNSLSSYNCTINSEEVVFKKVEEEEYQLLYKRNKAGQISGEYFKQEQFRGGVSEDKTFLKVAVENFYNPHNENTPFELTILAWLHYEINNIFDVETSESQLEMITISSSGFIEKYKGKLINALNELGINIEDIKIVNKPPYGKKVYFKRTSKGVSSFMPFDGESSGTKKVFKLLLTAIIAMERGTLLLVNDIDAYLHPKLVNKLIELMNSSLNTKAQLIFNSHDLLNMNNKTFRRDEIWFAYKNDELETELSCLANLVNYKGEQIRKDANYGKQYLEGRYGADPFISKGLLWGKE